MATYLELYTASGASALVNLQQQIVVAIAIKANTIAHSTTPTTSQKAWAMAALQSPKNYLQTVLNYILAEYNTSTIAVISEATDAQVQAAVNAAVDTLLGA